jgi:hypothetical protein
VRLSYASFDAYTRVTPTGAPGATLAHNPFIGPNPLSTLPNPPPGISIIHNGQRATGSFLFDTGAVTSMISTALAMQMHVRYVAGTAATDDPQLEVFDPLHPSAPGTLLPNQFQTTIGGIGGAIKVAGFFLDALVVPTMEGDGMNPDDPNHLRFLDAPVIVIDITLKNAVTGATFTLAGVLGMNYLVASLFVSEAPPFFGAFNPGPFAWVVFNEPAGVLGLTVSESELPPTFTLSPPSGLVVTTQLFDLVGVLEHVAPRTVVGETALLDGVDKTADFQQSCLHGTLPDGGQTYRCRGLSGAFLGSGAHRVQACLLLSDSTQVCDTTTWEVLDNTEP